MNVTISIDGVLTIWPESPAEQFALNRWTEENLNIFSAGNIKVFLDMTAAEEFTYSKTKKPEANQICQRNQIGGRDND